MRALADRVRVLLAILGPLGAGSRILLLRLVGRFGWKLAGAGVALVVYAVARYPKWFAWLLLAWCVAAWMHGPGDDVAEAGEQPAGESTEEPEDAPFDPLPGILWDLIDGAPGVHLKTIVEHLHTTGLDSDCDRGDVRDALTRRRIPFRPSVRGVDGRVNQGVHRDDLEAWEGACSPAPSVSLAKARSDAATTALTSDVAADATAVATPATAPRRPES